ncbi:MAG: TonB family protein [Myxococcales bacterium]|nr:TonB family protein [Myxococcales bacterium]
MNPSPSSTRLRAPRLVAAALGLLALSVAARAQAQDEVVPPSVLTSSEPVYPSNQVSSGKDVLVVLAVTVDAEGHVAGATVLESGGVDFDRAAIDAARLFTFNPGRRGERAIPTKIRVPFHFVPRRPAPKPVPSGPAHSTERPAAPVESVQVEGVARAPSRGASDFRLDREVLGAAPHRDAGELLLTAPGVYVARPEGDAVAQRIYLRGFDAVHGQDIELRAAGIPLNQGSHIHGQGYADLSIVIPETVRSLRVMEGVYDPRQGDFAVAGSAEFDLGVERRGLHFSAKMGSFGTQRVLALYAPEEAPQETFGAATFRNTDGFGDGVRGSTSGAGVGQVRLAVGANTVLTLHVAASAARGNIAGVLRRDDVSAGRVGFYDAYAFPTARAQSAGASRGQLGVSLEHRDGDGRRVHGSVWTSLTSFRSRTNFTGFTQRSQIEPSWVGRGDLIEQSNGDHGLGGTFSYRTARARVHDLVTAQLDVGTEVRTHGVEQAQNLLTAPQNATWDQRVDAKVRSTDIGLFADGLLAGKKWIRLRGGVRADLLFFDVDDKLGNFQPSFANKTHIVGFRRTAAGLVAGPRATLEVRPVQAVTATLSYGEGFRSPQARQLEEGEKAPFAKVRSFEGGVAVTSGALTASAIAYQTNLSYDLAFDAEEGRLERIGPTTRRGLVGTLRGKIAPWLTTSASATFVRATLDSPPVPTPEDPAPAYLPNQSLPYVPPLLVRTDTSAEHRLFDLWRQDVIGRLGYATTFLSPRPLPFGASSAAVFLVDMQASLRRGALEIGAETTNLLGARYAETEYAFVSSWRTGTPPSLLPARHLTAGPPRQVLFTLGLTL